VDDVVTAAASRFESPRNTDPSVLSLVPLRIGSDCADSPPF